MESITGIKLISAATVFGTAAIVFTSVPFLLVILSGMLKSKDRSTGGANFLGITLLAYFVHAISTICFVATMHVLDIFSRSKDANYFTNLLFEIFWAKDQSAVFSAAKVTETSSNEALGAYTTLITVRAAADLLYMALPVVVIMGAIAYGVGLSTKDTYRQDYLTVIIYAGVSMISAMLLYTLWIQIANVGLFLPDGDLFTKIANSWKAKLFI